MTSFILKIIALISMLADHVAAVFASETLIRIDSVIGRLAFPLYAFMIVDSFHHLSGDRLKKFMIFLGVIGVIIEPAFDCAFFGKIYEFELQNQLLQFFSYGLVFILAGSLKEDWQKTIAWIIAILVNQLLHLGYGGGGLMLMVMFDWYLRHYQDKSLLWRFVAMSVIMLLSVPILTVSTLMMYYETSVLLNLPADYIKECLKGYYPILYSIPILALYNGEYGNIPKWFRLFYRYFYPVHIIILAVIRMYNR